MRAPEVNLRAWFYSSNQSKFARAPEGVDFVAFSEYMIFKISEMYDVIIKPESFHLVNGSVKLFQITNYLLTYLLSFNFRSSWSWNQSSSSVNFFGRNQDKPYFEQLFYTYCSSFGQQWQCSRISIWSLWHHGQRSSCSGYWCCSSSSSRSRFWSQWWNQVFTQFNYLYCFALTHTIIIGVI